MGEESLKNKVLSAADHFISSIRKKERLNEQIEQIDKKILALQEQRKKLAEKRDRVGTYTQNWGRGKKAQKAFEFEQVRQKVSLQPKNQAQSNENNLGR